MIAKFGFKKLETSFYGVVQGIFRYLERFSRDSQVWQMDGRTDGQTDILLANTALNYVARPKRRETIV